MSIIFLIFRNVRFVENCIKFSRLFYKTKTYVTALAAVPKEALQHAESRIIVIGCGEAAAIDTYAGT